MVRTRVGSGPPPDLDQGLGILCARTLGPCCEQPGPCPAGGGGVRGLVPGVRARLWRFWTLPGGPVHTHRGPTLSHGGPDPLLISWVISSFLRPRGGPGADHVAVLGPTTWRGRALFTTRLDIVVYAPCLHTVVRGTPDSGYRQFVLASITKKGEIEREMGLIISYNQFWWLTSITNHVN
jgi:hypothetical protein